MKPIKKTKVVRKPRKSEVFTRRRDGSLVVKLNVTASKIAREEQEKLKKWGAVIAGAQTIAGFAKANKPLPKNLDAVKLISDLCDIREHIHRNLLDLNPEKKKVTLT